MHNNVEEAGEEQKVHCFIAAAFLIFISFIVQKLLREIDWPLENHFWGIFLIKNIDELSDLLCWERLFFNLKN